MKRGGSIEVEVTPEGDVTLKVVGMKGKGCLLATKNVEDALGETVRREMAPEFYQAEVQQKVGQRR